MEVKRANAVDMLTRNFALGASEDSYQEVYRVLFCYWGIIALTGSFPGS